MCIELTTLQNTSIFIRTEDGLSNECFKVRKEVVDEVMHNNIIGCFEGLPLNPNWPHINPWNNNSSINGIDNDIIHFLISSLYGHITFATYFEMENKSLFSLSLMENNAKLGLNGYDMTEYIYIKQIYLEYIMKVKSKTVKRIVQNVLERIHNKLLSDQHDSTLKFVDTLNAFFDNFYEITADQMITYLSDETSLHVIWEFALLFNTFIINEISLTKHLSITPQIIRKYDQFTTRPISSLGSLKNALYAQAMPLFGFNSFAFPESEMLVRIFPLNYIESFMAKSMAQCYLKSIEQHKNLTIVINDYHSMRNDSYLFQSFLMELHNIGIHIHHKLINIQRCIKRCPYNNTQLFEANKQNIYQLLMSINGVREIKEQYETTEFFYQAILLEIHERKYAAAVFMRIVDETKYEVSIKLVFSSPALGIGFQNIDEKYKMVNAWHENPSTNTQCHVNVNGNFEMERYFRFGKNWIWRYVYSFFSDELSLFLEQIYSFGQKLTENAIKYQIQVYTPDQRSVSYITHNRDPGGVCDWSFCINKTDDLIEVFIT
eukprot:122026_1